MYDVTYGEIRDRMGFHPADTELKRRAHETARTASIAHACFMADLLPPSREKSLAMTALQEALMWSNAALALNGGPKAWINDPGDLETILADFGAGYGNNLDDSTAVFIETAEGGAVPL
jgi:hypothetical protein